MEHTVINENDLINDLRRMLPELKSKFFVSRIGYFGRVVPDRRYPTHDIDLLVEFSKPVGWKFFELEDYLEYKLNRKIDITTEAGLSENIKNKVHDTVMYI